MKLLAWMLTLLLAINLFAAEESSKEIKDASASNLFKKASEAFALGKYNAAIQELKDVELKLSQDPSASKASLGLVAYWKGICHNRVQDYAEAIDEFAKALALKYVPQDLNYEYGQALFAGEKLQEARLQFRESIKKGFKRAVSLYYIAYISKELGDKKKAFTFYKAIEKLSDEEAKSVRQAAEMQIGDIFLEQVEKHPDAFRAVETYVIPQYEKALALDPDSTLAVKIEEKIVELQRKYDLVLFQLRNGRPALRPPHFMRLALEYGRDTNVTFAPTETNIEKSKQASNFVKTSAMGRYTFYHRDYFSIAPEMVFLYTRYLTRISEIYKNDNYYLAPSLRTAYEHTLFKNPASVLLDYEFGYVQRDVDAEERLKFNSRSHGLMLGERFNYFQRGESIARLRYRYNDSYLDTSDSKTWSLSFEQVWGFTLNTLLLYFSYDQMRMSDESFDTNSATFRGDLIMSRVRDWFTPSFGLALTATDPINDRTNRGLEVLFNPNARLSKTFGKNLRGNLKYDYQNNSSKDEANFAYKKQILSFELEYLF